MFNSVVTNAPFIGRVEKGVETSVYITEFAVFRILADEEVGAKKLVPEESGECLAEPR